MIDHHVIETPFEENVMQPLVITDTTPERIKEDLEQRGVAPDAHIRVVVQDADGKSNLLSALDSLRNEMQANGAGNANLEEILKSD